MKIVCLFGVQRPGRHCAFLRLAPCYVAMDALYYHLLTAQSSPKDN